MKFLIIIAACNEAASLDQFLPKLLQATGELEDHCDILVVDDGSTDTTANVSRKHGCVVMRNSQNAGIGASLRRGYRRAKTGGYNATITMDADGQHDPAFLVRMIEEFKKGADVVVASRYHQDSERIQVPLDRDMLNVAVAAQMRVATGWNVTDPLCGFWVMRRKWFEFALQYGHQTRYGVHLEHLIKFWYWASPRPKLVEVPHPAIYGNHGTRELLTRQYSPANREDRVERFGTHALHILQALEDVRRTGPKTVDDEIAERRKK